MLDLAILGLLREGPRHGYDLKRQLSEYGFWQVSFGSLYPALRRLEKGGFIEAGRISGRRKEYRPTEAGEVDRVLHASGLRCGERRGRPARPPWRAPTRAKPKPDSSPCTTRNP